MPIPNPDGPATDLTIRQHIAVEAMNGILSTGKVKKINDDALRELAKLCFRIADAMVTEGT